MITINPFTFGPQNTAKMNAQVNAGSGRYAGDARLKQLREARRLPRVRVVPTRPELRAVLGHPNGMRFRPSGSIEWPMDSYTQRRIRDGDVRVVADVKQPAASKRAAEQPAQTVRRPHSSGGGSGSKPSSSSSSSTS